MRSLIFLLPSILALVSPAWPFNSQLPAVARTNEYYLFLLADTTFSQPNVQYSLQDAPSWLSIDSKTGLLSGTPEEASSGFEFQILANGSNCSSTLVVSDSPPPKVISSSAIVDQLKAYGHTDGSSGLVLAPGTDFAISFEKSRIFEGNATYYYGRSKNHTALPPWVKFTENGSNVSFAGTAPAVNLQIAPSVEYVFDLVTLDIEGFSAASISFSILVGAHLFSTLVSGSLNVLVSQGAFFNQSLPLDQIYLDGTPVTKSNILKLLLDGNITPDWVKIDTNNIGVYGDVPDSFSSANISITVMDTFGDQVTLFYNLNHSDNKSESHTSTSPKLLNNATLPLVVNATEGVYFNYTLPKELFANPDNTSVDAFFDSSWLHYNSENASFFGLAPELFSPIEVSLSAFSNTTLKRSMTNTATFSIRGVPKATSAAPKKKLGSQRTLAIVLGTVLPIVFLILLAVAFLLFRRKRQSSDAEAQNITEEKSQDIYLAEKAQSFITAEEDLSVSKTISNHLETDGSKYLKHELLPSPRELYTGNNWQVVRDVSLYGLAQSMKIQHLLTVADDILNSARKDKSDTLSTSLSLTDVEFNEEFEGEPADESGATRVEDHTGETQYMDTVEYPEDTMDAATASIAQTKRILTGQNESRESFHQAKSIFFGREYKKEASKTTKAPVPRKSWRNVVDSTRLRLGSKRQESINSLATVSTDELFSMRLVDENRPIESAQISREDSGIIKRLDLNGNEIGPNIDRSLSLNLDPLEEETSAEIGRNRMSSNEYGLTEASKSGIKQIQNLLSFSERSRAQKASHSRKRNLSQTYSSLSNSHSKLSSSSDPSPVNDHQKDDLFSYEAFNPLPVIYSPQVGLESPTIPKRNPRREASEELDLSIPVLSPISDSSAEMIYANESMDAPAVLKDFNNERKMRSSIFRHHKRSHSSMGRSESKEVVYDYASERSN